MSYPALRGGPAGTMPGSAARNVAPISTMLSPNERLRLDAAGEGLFRTLHREHMDDVLRDLRERRADAVVLSVARCDDASTARMASVVREFPRVPAVALLSEVGPATPQAVLALGRSGVKRLVDVRQPAGWRELRSILHSERGDRMQERAVATIAADLAGAPEDCLRFFEELFLVPSRVATVRALARRLHVVPSSLMSRFLRAGLPTPKRYLAYARLVRAASLCENPGWSIATVANTLDYSSPQSFGRHVRTLLGVTAQRFRERYDGPAMLDRFREELVLPYRVVLRRFAPLAAMPAPAQRASGQCASGQRSTPIPLPAPRVEGAGARLIPS